MHPTGKTPYRHPILPTPEHHPSLVQRRSLPLPAYPSGPSHTLCPVTTAHPTSGPTTRKRMQKNAPRCRAATARNYQGHRPTAPAGTYGCHRPRHICTTRVPDTTRVTRPPPSSQDTEHSPPRLPGLNYLRRSLTTLMVLRPPSAATYEQQRQPPKGRSLPLVCRSLRGQHKKLTLCTFCRTQKHTAPFTTHRCEHGPLPGSLRPPTPAPTAPPSAARCRACTPLH